jgi:protein-disulfide isomerase
MVREYDGRVRLVVKDFPLGSHSLARPAHEAARCAAQGGRFWPYHDRLFDAQPRFEREDLVRYADEVGLDRQRFLQCLEARTFAAAVEADVSQGRALGVRGTPTFLINGQVLVGAQSVETFRRVIDQALARKP